MMTLTSFFVPVYTIVPAIIISNIRPKEATLGYPFPELKNNSEYRYAYEKEAFHIKKKKTWGGVFLGTGIILGVTVAGLVAVAATLNH